MKIKKGDTVIVTTGKDKGKEGTVVRSFPKQLKVLIEGVNVVNRHQKSKRRGSQGQILKKSMPIPVANVACKDAKTGKASRVGYTIEGEGKDAKKVRVTRKSGSKI
jgi:large subunit ribosomal protein L24